MKQAILYIGHGSRLKKAQTESAAFLKGCMPHADAPIQEICFLELQEPSIEAGFEACVRQGATHIAAVPLLLLTAAHAKHDIPAEIARAAALHPDIKVTYGVPIGVDDEVVKAVHHRIEDTGVPIEQAKVVLIGRGSTDPAVKNAVSEIAGKLEAIIPVKEVIPCFLTACDPHYKEVFAGLEEDDGAPVFIVPYLLFTGLLMTEIEREVEKLQTINQNVHLASYLGFHPHIKQAFLNRVSEAVRNPGGQFDFKGGQYAASAH